jgi:Glycosyl transferases group 1
VTACVNWVLFDGRTLASSRLQGHAIHDFLVQQGHPSRLLSTPPFPLRDAPWRGRAAATVAELAAGQVVVVQKLGGPRTEELLRALRERGAAVVYAAADLEPENELPLRCNAVVCSSRLLAEHWRAAGANAVEIPEPADFWLEPDGGDRGRVRLCWIGHRKNWDTVEPIRRLLREPGFSGYELVTVSNHHAADVQWSLEAAKAALAAADVGIVPTRVDELARYASSNRVVQVMAAGRPVVAGRIPPYEELIVDGENGFLCSTESEWRAALAALAEPARRRELARRAWEPMRERFRLEAVGVRWLEVFAALEPGPSPRRSPLGEARLLARARAAASAAYASEAADRDFGLPAVGEAAAAALARLPLAPAAGARAAAATARAVARAARRRIR